MVQDIETKLVTYLKPLLILSIIFLLYFSNFMSIDHQDNWVLSGLELPYVIFVLFYILYFSYEDNPKNLIVFSIVTRMLFVLIPNLKYDFFLGRNIDQHQQYNLANIVMKTGFISDANKYYSLTSKYYLGVPLLHLSLSIFSIISGLPLYQTLKFLPVLWNISYPLVTYAIAKETKIIKNEYLYKSALFLSSIPISTSITYIITGSLFVSLLTYYYLYYIIKVGDRILTTNKNFFLFLIFITTSVLSHSIFTLHYLVILLAVIIIIKVGKITLKISLIQKLLLVAFLLDMTWITYQAIPLKLLTSFLKALGISKAVTPTLITLTQVDVIATVKIVILIYGADILISGLIFFSIIILYYKKSIKAKYNKIYPLLAIYMIIIWILTVIGFVFGITYNYWGRVLRLSYFAYPFLYGIFLYEQQILKNRRIIMLAVFTMIALFCTIQFYKHPSFIPAASSISDLLPKDEPLLYRGQVNSIYQRDLIAFSEKVIDGRIACDAVTRNQIFGLTDTLYSRKYLTWYFPPNRLFYPDMEERQHSFFLFHLPGVSGSYEEKAFVRSKDLIISQLYDNSYDIIFSNSVSFVLRRR